MMLLGSPNKLSLGESPLIVRQHSVASHTSNSNAEETPKSPQIPVVQNDNHNADQINISNESEVYHSFDEENLSELPRRNSKPGGTDDVHRVSRDGVLDSSELDAEKQELIALTKSLKEFIVQCNNLTAQVRLSASL